MFHLYKACCRKSFYFGPNYTVLIFSINHLYFYIDSKVFLFVKFCLVIFCGPFSAELAVNELFCKALTGFPSLKILKHRHIKS